MLPRYDVARNVWEFVACMAERRYRPGVATLGGRMYVLGGEEGWDRYHDTIGDSAQHHPHTPFLTPDTQSATTL